MSKQDGVTKILCTLLVEKMAANHVQRVKCIVNNELKIIQNVTTRRCGGVTPLRDMLVYIASVTNVSF